MYRGNVLPIGVVDSFFQDILGDGIDTLSNLEKTSYICTS